MYVRTQGWGSNSDPGGFMWKKTFTLPFFVLLGVVDDLVRLKLKPPSSRARAFVWRLRREKEKKKKVAR